MLVVQQVYQFLAGYPDGNDADPCRHDALVQLLQGVAPDPAGALASEACASLDEVAKATGQTLRDPYGKVPAEVSRGEGAVRGSLAGDGEYRPIWEPTLLAVRRHATALQAVGEPPGAPHQATGTQADP